MQSGERSSQIGLLCLVADLIRLRFFSATWLQWAARAVQVRSLATFSGFQGIMTEHIFDFALSTPYGKVRILTSQSL